MPDASSRVLLLGWNEAPRAEEPAAPPLRTLVQQLARLSALSVLLPRQPQPPFAAGEAGRVTGLAELDPTVAMGARPDPYPAAWQAPAAPYQGSGIQTPAAPYQGATPISAGPNAVPESAPYLPPPIPAPGAGPLGATLPVAAGAAANAPTQPPRPTTAGALPGPGEGVESELATSIDLTTDQNLARPPLPAPVIPAAALPAVTRVHATLTEALAALGRTLPSSAAADLNYQVIQYARFATSWAGAEQFAVIYAVDWATWLAAMEIRQQTGRPLVLHVHSLAQERAVPAETGWAVALERLALRRADLVLAASAEVAHLLTERYQLPPARLRTVAGTDTAAINELLLHIEHYQPGRPAVTPITPPTP